MWWEEIQGVRCVPPSELGKIENLLCVTYVKNDVEIRKQLRQLGIRNIINVYDIYNLFERED